MLWRFRGLVRLRDWLGRPRRVQPKRNSIHETPVVIPGQGLGAVRDSPKHVVKPGLIRFGKVLQDVVRDRVFVSWMTNAHTNAAVSITNMRVERSKPVVSRMTAALLCPELSRREIDFVMKHHNF